MSGFVWYTDFMISRLFQIVYKLMDCPQMTAKELAAEVGVSERTIYRDVEKLSLAGIPIYANQGENGGIALLPNYVLDKTVLSDDEKKKILESLNALNTLSSSFNIEETTDFDSLKSFLGDSKGFYDWLEVEFSTWGNRVQDENLFNILKSGILNRQVLKIEYASYKSEISERKIKPLKICFKNESWYLYAFCLLRNDYRFFKFSRIHRVEKLDESFTPEITGKVLPKMSEQYANNLGSQTKVILEVDSKMSWRAFDELEVLEHLENGNLRCAVNIPDISWGISYLLSFGSGIKVIEPDSVKNMLLQEIEKMLKNAK